MKDYMPWIIFMLIMIMIAFGIDNSSRCKEVELQLQTERFYREQSDLEHEKEIRLLKQDVYVLKYGYEGAENVCKD